MLTEATEFEYTLPVGIFLSHSLLPSLTFFLRRKLSWVINKSVCLFLLDWKIKSSKILSCALMWQLLTTWQWSFKNKRRYQSEVQNIFKTHQNPYWWWCNNQGLKARHNAINSYWMDRALKFPKISCYWKAAGELRRKWFDLTKGWICCQRDLWHFSFINCSSKVMAGSYNARYFMLVVHIRI